MRAAQTSVASPERPRLPALVFGPFTFDTNSRLLSRDGREVALPPRVLGVLELLLRRAGDVVSRQELIDAVWKDAFVTDTSLAEAVSVLRQGLGDDPQSPTYIQTLHRRGYRFVATVTTSGLEASDDAVREAPAPAPEGPASPSIGGQLVPWSAAVICALIAGGAIWQLTTRNKVFAPPAIRFAVVPGSGVAFDRTAPSLAISPDGNQLAWSGCDATGCRVYLRPIDTLDARAIDGSDDAHAPFFSPDGRWIAFFADGRLKKVAVAGGTPITIADAPSVLGGVWLDREIVFAGSPVGGLMRVSADGGEPQALTTPHEPEGEVRHTWPAVIRNRSILLFTIETTLGNESSGLLGALPLDGAGTGRATSWRTLLAAVDLVRPAAEDTLVFSRGPEIQAIAFDPIRLAASGTPRTVLGSVATAGGRADYAVSSTGTLIHARADASGGHGLAWLTGGSGITQEVAGLRDAELARDGSRLAGVKAEGGRSDIWVADVQRGASTRLTHTGVNTAPVWSADERAVYFASRSEGPFAIWRRDADGGAPATRLFQSVRHAIPLAASPDGAWLAFLQTADQTRSDVWLLPLAGGEPRALVHGPFDETAASFSPDSTMIAFQSSETGRWEIYVQRIADGRRTVVSTGGGERPMWMRDGLYYQARGRLMRAPVASSGSELHVGPITEVASLSGATARGIANDGRILIDRAEDTARSTAIVSLEWLREVKAMLGPPAAALPR